MLVPKSFTCFKDYSRQQFFKDFISGIIVAIIALPLSIALAIASGVSPEKGLYTAIIGGFIVSFLGGSRVQIGGPTGAFVVIVYGIIEKYGVDGLTIATIMAGFFLIIMGFCKFGSVIKYIPYPITTGFTTGIAITILSTQLKDFFGLTMGPVPSEFIHKCVEYAAHINSINYQSLLIALLSLAIIIFWPKINKTIPGTLIAILAATIITMVFNLNVETIGSRFTNLSSALPKPIHPNITWSVIQQLIPPAFTIAALGAVESLLSAVVADGMIGGKHRSNMELIGQGTANVFSALFGGIPVTGAIARTAANVKNGGRTPMAGMVHAAVLALIMLILIPYVKLIPMASLAAILVMVSYNMGEWEVFKRLPKAPKSDASVFLVTLLLTIFFDLVIAIGVGMVLASFLFMKRMSDITNIKSIDEYDEDSEGADILNELIMPEHVSFYEINGPFFFGAADKFINVIRELDKPSKVLIIKMSHVPVMDATAYNAMLMLHDLCRKHSTKLILLELNEQPFNLLKKYGFVDTIGEDNFCSTSEDAIQRANMLLAS